jgi:hypothetical protein
MPRRKSAEVEILPLEDDQHPKGRKKLVEAEHTIKYSAPVPVTVEDDPTEDNPEEDFDFVEEEKARRRKKTAKDERDDLRREMDKLGVASVSRLKLSIDKYRNSDSDESGTLAEKDYCEKYPVTKEHILNDDYMAVARKYGAGRYWFTLRMDNKIVRQWERQVNQALTPSGPVIQHVNPADPTSPQVIIQSTNGDGQQYQPPSMRDIMKGQKEALKEHLEMTKLMREAYGFTPEQQQQESKSEEEIIAGAIIKQPAVIESVVESIIKRVGGKGGNDDGELSVTSVLMKAVENNQLASSIQAFGNVALAIVDRIFPKWGQNNGQAQVATPPLQTTGPADSQGATDGRTVVAQEIAQSNQSLQPASGEVDQQGGMLPAAQDPYAQMLTGVITTLINNGPVEDAVKRVDGFLLMAPQYTEAIDAQFSQPAENLLGAISTIPGCEQIAQAEHAKGWIESFQAKFFEESQEGEDA